MWHFMADTNRNFLDVLALQPCECGLSAHVAYTHSPNKKFHFQYATSGNIHVKKVQSINNYNNNNTQEAALAILPLTTRPV